MKKIILIIICSFMLCGCSDYIEINDLAILTGIAIDYKDELYDVTAQLIINEKDSDVVVYNSKSKSIEEAIAEISKLCNKEIFLPDLKTLIITKNIIDSDINYYDYFLRSSQSKMNFYVYLADSEKISDILSIYDDKYGSSLYADKMMKFNNKIFSSSTPLDFITLVKAIVNDNIDAAYPVITIKENNGEKSLYLEDLVIFDKDKNTIKLSENESIFYNILTNNARGTVLTIPCDDEYFAININDVNTKFNYKKDTFYINVNSSGKIYSYTCKYDVSETSGIEKLNNISKEYIYNQINDLVKLNIKNKVDFLGIRDYIYKHNYKEFNDFDINKTKIVINVNSSIGSFGESRKKLGELNHES